MATILKDGSVFIHIPKTGGTWVTDVLSEMGLKKTFISHKHMDLRMFLQPEHLKKCGLPPDTKPFIFTFVRKPTSWYESWWRFSKMRDWVTWGKAGIIKEYSWAKWHPNAMINDCLDRDFNQTVRNICCKRPGYVTEMFGWYTHPGFCDFVGKQENLREDLVHVLDQLGLSYNKDVLLSHSKKRVSDPPEVNWDKELKKKVKRLEYAAYKRYEY